MKKLLTPKNIVILVVVLALVWFLWPSAQATETTVVNLPPAIDPLPPESTTPASRPIQAKPTSAPTANEALIPLGDAHKRSSSSKLSF